MREQDRIVRLKIVLARIGLSRSTIYRKIRAGSRFSSKSTPTGPAGMNPTSIAGSQIRSDGVRKAGSMKAHETVAFQLACNFSLAYALGICLRSLDE